MSEKDIYTYYEIEKNLRGMERSGCIHESREGWSKGRHPDQTDLIAAWCKENPDSNLRVMESTC